VVISYKRGHWSIDGPITSDRNECRQTSKTCWQTKNKKMNNADVTPLTARHTPITTIHELWPVKEATCGRLPIESRDML